MKFATENGKLPENWPLLSEVRVKYNTWVTRADPLLSKIAEAYRYSRDIVRDYYERRQSIAELESLDDRLLRDIGLNRYDIRRAVCRQCSDRLGDDVNGIPDRRQTREHIVA